MTHTESWAVRLAGSAAAEQQRPQVPLTVAAASTHCLVLAVHLLPASALLGSLAQQQQQQQLLEPHKQLAVALSGLLSGKARHAAHLRFGQMQQLTATAACWVLLNSLLVHLFLLPSKHQCCNPCAGHRCACSTPAAVAGAAAASDLTEGRLAALDDAIRDTLRAKRSVVEDSKALLLRLFM
jgi:hypothetical protein